MRTMVPQHRLLVSVLYQQVSLLTNPESYVWREAMLQDAINTAEGAGDASEEKTELEELKQLLPDIREKVEDAKESQRMASAASQAIQQTLVGAKEQSGLGNLIRATT